MLGLWKPCFCYRVGAISSYPSRCEHAREAEPHPFHQENPPRALAGVGNQRHDFAEENRMSWMVVGLAVRLGCERRLLALLWGVGVVES